MASELPVPCGLRTGVKQGFGPRRRATIRSSVAMQGQALVGRHRDDRRRATWADAALDGFEQDAANVGPTGPGMGRRAPGDDLAVMGIDDDGAADDVAVPGRGERDRVAAVSQGAPRVRAHGRRQGQRRTMTLPSRTCPGRFVPVRARRRPWAVMIRQTRV